MANDTIRGLLGLETTKERIDRLNAEGSQLVTNMLTGAGPAAAAARRLPQAEANIRRNVAGMGLDIRPASERLQEALAAESVNLGTSAGMMKAAEMAKQMGLTSAQLNAENAAQRLREAEQKTQEANIRITNLQNSVANQAAAAGNPELAEVAKYITDPEELQEIALKLAEGKEDKIVSKGAGIWDGEKYIMPPTQEEPEAISYQKVNDSVLVFRGADLLGQYSVPSDSDDEKATKDSANMRDTLVQELGRTDAIMRTVDQAIEASTWFATGKVGAAIGSTAFTKAGSERMTLEQFIDTIQANLGFDELQKMRNNSPTGGALGQVAVRELEMLQATIAGLNPDLNKDVLIPQLNKIKRHYENYKNLLLGKPASNIDWNDPSYSGSVQILDNTRFIKDAEGTWWPLGPVEQ